ncbi:MAG TPA: STAS domain-containing protein [Anaerolineaceae bacterium]|nr:STAS domain-containing protein [Anaerolineaceae bacterium]
MIRTLEAEIEKRNGIAIIDLKGEISSRAESTFLDAFERANDQHSRVILLNLEQVEYINSAGIALIIRMVADARQTGCPVAVSGLSQHYREIFHITRLDDFVTIFSDRDEAVRTLSKTLENKEGR